MAEISRVALFGKLNSLAYKAIEAATVFCKLRGNPYVELVHWFHQILQLPDSDLHQIVRQSGIDPGAPGQGPDRRARPPAARLDLDHRPVLPCRGSGGARLGLRQPDVRREPGAHRLPGDRHPQDAEPAPCPHRAVGGIRQAQGRGAHRASSPRSWPPRPRTACPPAMASAPTQWAQRARRGPRRARPAARWRRARWAARRPCSSSPWTSPRRRASGTHRPHRRPRRGDPPGGRHPDAPPPEQPDPDRRGRRRQDRGGGGLRAAHRRRRRAAGAEGRRAARARHRPAAGRREHEGRVREPPAPGDRRGAGLAAPDHPVHRRGPHADRRGRRGRHRRRRQPAQAGPGARQPAHHRGHHLGRVQEAHREGPGADPALPGGAGGRARARPRRS